MCLGRAADLAEHRHASIVEEKFMLSQAQIDQFNRDGYLVVEDLITQPIREAVKQNMKSC